MVELDEQNGKVNLSLKQLSQDPWEDKAGSYKVGQKVDGTVTKITSYGIILDVDQITGLLKDAGGDYKVSDTLSAYVANIDNASRRLDLTLEKPE